MLKISGNRRRRLLRVGKRPDPPLKPFTNTSDIYISYTLFLRGFINTQGLFNRTAPVPGNLTYAAFMDVVAQGGSIKSRNELSAFVAHAVVASKGLTRVRDSNTNIFDELTTRSYCSRGYLGLEGITQYKDASLDLFNDQRLLEAPELILQDETINWKTSLWNWKRVVLDYNLQQDFANVTEALLGPKLCETVYKVYSILKQEWDPKSKQYKGCKK